MSPAHNSNMTALPIGEPLLSEDDKSRAAIYGLTRVEAARVHKRCPADGFPSHDRTHSHFGAGRCEVILGTNDEGEVFLSVYPPAAVGLPQRVDLSGRLRQLLAPAVKKAVSQPSAELSAGGVQAFEPLPDPRTIDKTPFEAFEKLVRSGDKVPRHLWEGIVGHVEHGHHTGAALSYILEGDIFKAAIFADDGVRRSLGEIAQFIAQQLPLHCHGSPKKVKAWRTARIQDRAAQERRDMEAAE